VRQMPIIRVIVFPSQLHGRYKNRLQLSPESQCVGVDMHRYAHDSKSPSEISSFIVKYRNWVGFLIPKLPVDAI
jgi:hypothetical protein